MPSFFSPQPPFAEDLSPSALAAELAEHRAAFDAGRASVIDRGVTRVEQIKQLRKELEIEQTAHEEVLTDARQ